MISWVSTLCTISHKHPLYGRGIRMNDLGKIWADLQDAVIWNEVDETRYL